MEHIDQVIDILTLEELDLNLFRGKVYKTPWDRVFGGQVLGQSIHAAYRTVPEDRKMHSMHAYFILPGDCTLPIIYDVDTIRDGGSFTTRRIIARQKGRAIFNMAASFQLDQQGVDHQAIMPEVPLPESIKSMPENLKPLKFFAPKVYKKLLGIDPNAFEFRPVQNIYKFPPQNFDPHVEVWIKPRHPFTASQSMQQQILACASDYGLLRTASLPHQTKFVTKNLMFASLDHAMWFHRDFEWNDWMLFVTDSPNASNSRGLSWGNIFDRSGRLIASMAQEGLMRVKSKK